MKTLKQKHIEVKGTMYAVCPFCNEIIRYSEGVNLNRGIEAHITCVRQKRQELQNCKG